MHTVLIYIKKQCSIQRGLTVLLFVILSLGFEPKPSIKAFPRGGEHRAAECKWVACMCTGMYSEPAGLHETCTSWPTVHTSMSKKDTHKKHARTDAHTPSCFKTHLPILEGRNLPALKIDMIRERSRAAAEREHAGRGGRWQLVAWISASQTGPMAILHTPCPV